MCSLKLSIHSHTLPVTNLETMDLQTGNVGEKAKDLAGDAKGSAKSAAGKVEDKAGDAADEAKVNC